MFLIGMEGVVFAKAIIKHKINSLLPHMMNHTSEKVSICTKRDNRKIESHMQVHTGECVIKCVDMNCIGQGDSSEIGLCIECEYCSYQLHHTSEEVYEVLYSEKKPFSCSVCDYRYNHLYNSNHIGEKEFSSVFSDIMMKLLTEGLHTGKKPIQCSKGDFRASQLDKGFHNWGKPNLLY